MSQYIMNIDSTYRDQKQYPLSTEFGVIVNSTPNEYASGNIYTVENIIYSRFTWNGTATTTVPDDTIEGNFTDFTDRVITLDPANASTVLNFYTGCLFILDSGVSSVIRFYDPQKNTIVLENPIPLAFYNPANTGYSIVNPSYNYLNDIVLLGTNVFVNLSANNTASLFFLRSGPTNVLFVQDATAGWILPIDKILPGSFRTATFATDMPSYTNGDIFQVRASPRILLYTTVNDATPSSICSLYVSERGSGYSVGDVVEVVSGTAILLATYRVLAVDQVGGIRDLDILDPGAGYGVGSYVLSDGINTTARVVVDKVSWCVQVDQRPPEGMYLMYVLTISPFGTAFFCVTAIIGVFIFFTNNSETPIPTNTSIELMRYKGYTTGLRAPVVSYKQPVCYDVSLIHLIIPNQPIYGFDVLPTFFPYIMVELYNTSLPGSNAGILYSNNPNTERVTFYCPIGNPRNPLIVSYLIIVSSTQVQTIKWTPTDNFFFRVLLPNGETLRYTFDQDINESILLHSTCQDEKILFYFQEGMTDRRVAATFSFRLKKSIDKYLIP